MKALPEMGFSQLVGSQVTVQVWTFVLFFSLLLLKSRKFTLYPFKLASGRDVQQTPGFGLLGIYRKTLVSL